MQKKTIGNTITKAMLEAQVTPSCQDHVDTSNFTFQLIEVTLEGYILMNNTTSTVTPAM